MNDTVSVPAAGPAAGPVTGRAAGPAAGPALVRVADRPGDLGFVTALHGVLYDDEYGMDQSMEAYVAGGLAEYALARAREGERAGMLWVAEAPDDGRILGSIGITPVPGDPATMQLRWFLLDPACRGQGLGRRMRDLAVGHARERGARSVVLWTVAGLAAAHHLYVEAGFTLTESRAVRKWGIDTEEQRFDLDLGGR